MLTRLMVTFNAIDVEDSGISPVNAQRREKGREKERKEKAKAKGRAKILVKGRLTLCAGHVRK